MAARAAGHQDRQRRTHRSYGSCQRQAGSFLQAADRHHDVRSAGRGQDDDVLQARLPLKEAGQEAAARRLRRLPSRRDRTTQSGRQACRDGGL